MKTKAFIALASAMLLLCACDRNRHNGDGPDNHEPVPFTDRMEQGVYSVTSSDSKAITVFPDATSQYIKSVGLSSKSIFRMVDFNSSAYLELTLEGTTFAEGNFLSYTVKSAGISSAPQGGTELNVVQTLDNFIWLEDSANGTGYIISK